MTADIDQVPRYFASYAAPAEQDAFEHDYPTPAEDEAHHPELPAKEISRGHSTAAAEFSLVVQPTIAFPTLAVLQSPDPGEDYPERSLSSKVSCTASLACSCSLHSLHRSFFKVAFVMNP